MLSLVPLDGHGAGQGPHRSDREVQEEATGYSSDGRTEGGRILFGWQSRLGHSGSRHRTTRSSYSRRHPNLHEAGPNGRRRRRPCPLDCGKERSSLLSPSLTSGHGTRNIPAWVMFMRTEGAPPSTWLLVVGQFPSSVARAGCRRLALRLLRMSDAHLGTGTGGPLASSVQALHNTGDLTCPAGGQKCALHFLGLLLSWAHVCGPQPGGLDRDSRRRPMPLIILGRRRLRLDMTTQGVASRVTTTIRVGDGTLRQ